MADVFELIREDLVRVEAQLGKDSVSRVPAITDIGTYLQQSGGKRIRPALVLLTARLVACDGEAVIRLAAVVEMIHNATLIHDDIIDEADTRRGRPSTNSRWGTHMCVLAGDWLYMQAFNVALRERNFAVLDTLIGLTQTMVEGELMQLQTVGTVISAAQHHELMERKRRSCSPFRPSWAPWPRGNLRRSSSVCTSTAITWDWRSRWWTICWISPAIPTRWASRWAMISGKER